jgi:hypothetical protein
MVILSWAEFNLSTIYRNWACYCILCVVSSFSWKLSTKLTINKNINFWQSIDELILWIESWNTDVWIWEFICHSSHVFVSLTLIFPTNTPSTIIWIVLVSNTFFIISTQLFTLCSCLFFPCYRVVPILGFSIWCTSTNAWIFSVCFSLHWIDHNTLD